MKTKDLVMCALLAAVICVLAPLSAPIGPIPISLATFAVMLAAAILGAKWGTIATLIYILLGAVGVPVFAGYSAGVAKLVSSTGGYIIGYIPLAYLTGLGVTLGIKTVNNKKVMKYVTLAAGMVVGTVVLYVLGTAWFIHVSGNALADAMGWCVTPFIPGDLLKMVVVALIAPTIRAALIRSNVIETAVQA